MKDIIDSINRNYQAFLSHHSDDKPQVEEIAIQLEKNGITTFLDKWHLIPGTPWQSAIEDALGGDCLNRSISDLSEAEKLELRTPLHMPTAVVPTHTAR